MLKHKNRLWGVLASLTGVLLFSPAVVPVEGTAVAATAQEKAALAAIQAAAKKSDAAFSRKDLEGAVSVLAPDFVGILPNGTRMSLQAYKSQTKALFNAAQSIQVQSTIRQFTLKGNTAIVVGQTSSTAVLRAPVNQKNSVLKSTENSQSTWVKRGGKWLVLQSKVLSHQTTLNGKQVKM